MEWDCMRLYRRMKWTGPTTGYKLVGIALRSMSPYKRDGRAPIPVSETTSKVMSANRGKDTGPEMLLRRALRDAGLPGYRLHWKDAPGRPDIVFPRYKVAIFVHGDFWHRCPTCALPLPKTHTEFWEQKLEKNVQRDRMKVEALEMAGWKVFVCWEHEVKADPAACAKRVQEHISALKVACP